VLKPETSQWVDRVAQQCGTFDASTAERFAATLGIGELKAADAVPYLAHWCVFTPDAATAELSADGHPRLGDFLPPVQLSRRMWAGGSLEFLAPLHVGAEITRTSKIMAITEKDGAAGPMVFVTVTHDVFEDRVHAISETQDIVYLNIPEVFSPPQAKPTPAAPDVIEPAKMSEALLFRYSAVTFNAHRIHYDLPYAQQVEKYPGLVVHGPLQATLLMQTALRHAPGRTPRTFRFRGVHPMFHFDDMHIFGQDTDNGMTLCTGLVGGHQGMQAKITWEDVR
jgi:3-methylfumaryl-CoA hydratase